MAYGAGRFVAVGQYGAIVTSEDGERWLSSDLESQAHLADVAWNADWTDAARIDAAACQLGPVAIRTASMSPRSSRISPTFL